MSRSSAPCRERRNSDVCCALALALDVAFGQARPPVRVSTKNDLGEKTLRAFLLFGAGRGAEPSALRNSQSCARSGRPPSRGSLILRVRSLRSLGAQARRRRGEARLAQCRGVFALRSGDHARPGRLQPPRRTRSARVASRRHVWAQQAGSQAAKAGPGSERATAPSSLSGLGVSLSEQSWNVSQRASECVGE